jgi:hypothetical protein
MHLAECIRKFNADRDGIGVHALIADHLGTWEAVEAMPDIFEFGPTPDADPEA